MGLGILNGGWLCSTRSSSLRRQRACAHGRLRPPRKPIGILYDYLWKRFTIRLATIQLCRPAHCHFPNSRERAPRSAPTSASPPAIQLTYACVFRVSRRLPHPPLGEGQTLNFPAKATDVCKLLSSACFAKCAAYKSAPRLSPHLELVINPLTNPFWLKLRRKP